MSIIKNLGIRLREIRKSRGFTQIQLANAMDIEPNTISQIELGERLPKKETLEKLCSVLDLEPKELFDFGHLKTKDELMQEIIQTITNADLPTLQCFHKIITSINEMK